MAFKNIPRLKRASLFRESSDDGDIFTEDGPKTVEEANATILDKFDGTEIKNEFWNAATGTGTAVVANGALTLTPGAAAGNTIRIFGKISESLVNNVSITAEIKMKYNVTTAHAKIYAGLSATSLEAENDYAYVENEDQINIGVLSTSKDGVATTGGNQTITNNQSHDIKIILSKTGMTWYKNGEELSTHTTDIPDDIPLFFFFAIERTDTTGTQELIIEEVKLYSNRT